jgi:hypothetical protein
MQNSQGTDSVDSTPWVFEIPERNFEKLCERFAKLIKRSRKNHLNPPQFTVIWEREEKKTKKRTNNCSDDSEESEGQYVLYYYVTVDGERPVLKDWEFVATIDHTPDGNLIKSVPGAGKIPTEFRGADPVCHHCNTARRRTETFVVRNLKDGSHKQVGRNCLQDFFDGDSPSDIAAMLQWWTEAVELASEFGDDEDSFGGSGKPRYGLEGVLTLTQAVIDCIGWLSRSKARDNPWLGTATADWVGSLLAPPRWWSTETKELSKKLTSKDDYPQITADALEWIRELPLDVEEDYLYNLKVACGGESVRYDMLGLACSLIPAYRRHLNEEIRRAEWARKKPSEFVGTVGDRQVFEVTVKYIGEAMSSYSGYGTTTRVTYEDQEGNTLIWWASGDPIGELGETLSIVATVKKHEVYESRNGPVNQTVINRVKKWDGKPLKKCKK